MQCSSWYIYDSIYEVRRSETQIFQKLSSETFDASRSVGWCKVQQVTMDSLHDTAMNIVATFILFHSVTSNSS